MDEDFIHQQVNLLDKQLREEQALLSAKRISYISLVFISLLIIYSGYEYFNVIRLENKAASLVAERKQITEAVANLGKATPNGATSTLEDEVEHLRREKEQKLRIKEMLSGTQLGSIKGFSTYLEGLAQEIIPNVWLTSIEISDGGRKLDIQGSTLDPKLVPRFIQRLSTEQSFAGSEFSIFRMRIPEEVQDKSSGKAKLAKVTEPYHMDFVIRTSADIEDKNNK